MRTLTLVLVTATLSCSAMGPVSDETSKQAQLYGQLEVQGHRGARGLLPENTLQAFAYAVDAGVDTLELDVLVTSDDRVVILHDPVVNPARCRHADGRSLDTPIVVRETSLEDLQGLDCGSIPHPDFPDQVPVPGARIPTLEELLTSLNEHRDGSATRVRLNIELKNVPAEAGWAPPAEHYVGLVLALIRQHGWLGRASIQSFDHRLLREVQRQSPGTPLALLISRNHVDLVALVRAFGPGALTVSPHQDWITAGDVTALRKTGARVVPYTVNEPEDWERLLGFGVDGIITDYPRRLGSYLRQR